MSDYLKDVRHYDAAADEATVAKIVKHLGIALRNRDFRWFPAQIRTN